MESEEKKQKVEALVAKEERLQKRIFFHAGVGCVLWGLSYALLAYFASVLLDERAPNMSNIDLFVTTAYYILGLRLFGMVYVGTTMTVGMIWGQKFSKERLVLCDISIFPRLLQSAYPQRRGGRGIFLFRPKLLGTLVEMLPLVTPEDHHLFKKPTVQSLNRCLTQFHTPLWDNFIDLHKKDPARWLQTYSDVVRILTFVGDTESLKTMKRLAKREPNNAETTEMQSILKSAIPVLEERVRSEIQENTLLRASGLEAPPSELLRASSREETPQEELLRPTQNDPEPQVLLHNTSSTEKTPVYHELHSRH
jgi:hypothetical protein